MAENNLDAVPGTTPEAAPAEPTPTLMSYDEAAGSVLHSQATQIRNNVMATQKDSPDLAAQYQHLAKFTNTPVESVYAQPDAVKQQAAMQKLDTGKLTTDYPHLSQFLSDQYNTAKSHDDIPNLATVEGTARAVPPPPAISAPPSFDTPTETPGVGPGDTMGIAPGNLPDVSGVEPMQLYKGAASSVDRLALAANRIMSLYPSAYDKIASIYTGKDTNQASQWFQREFLAPLEAREKSLQPAPDASIMNKTLFGAGDLAGTLAAIAASGGMSEAPAIAEGASALTGTVAKTAAAAKTMLVPSLTAAINTGHDVYAQTGSLAQAVKASLAAYGTSTAMGILPVSMEGNVGTRVATGFPVGVLTGEANRQVMNLALPTKMQSPADLDQLIVNGLTGSVLAGAVGRNPTDRALIEQQRNGMKVAQAEKTMAALQALSDAATATKLRDRDGDSFKQFVQNISDSGQAPDLYVDAKTLADSLDQAGVTVEMLKQTMPDVAEKMKGALVTLGDVRIPMADFAAHIAGSPLGEALLPHMKTDPEGITYAQGQEYQQRLSTELEGQAKNLSVEQQQHDERTAQLDAISDNIAEQLDATGRFPKTVTQEYAKLHRTWYDTMSQRLGISPEEVAKRYPLTIKATGEGELAQGETNAGQPEPTGDGSGQPGRGRAAPLEGSPTVKGASGPDEGINRVAEQYAREHGIPLKRQTSYATVDPERAARIAHEYDIMEHNPQDPKVQEAYQDLIRQTTDQYQALVNSGYRFWFIDDSSTYKGEPYAASPFNAMRDMRENKSMGVFPSDEGFGSSDADVSQNPLLADTGLQWPMGSPDGPLHRVTANDLFRAVHDAFGHGIEGAGFRAQGEENAWQAHARLFTGPALGAITSETRGQNSWLNYGPHGEANRNAKVEDTVFADQKTGLMPEWTWREGFDEGVEAPLEQGARGSFSPADSTIHLLPDADLSTFLHESGHFYLEALHDMVRNGAPSEVAKDFDTLLQSFGVAGDTPGARLDAWNDMSLDEKRAGHEQFAEGFEDYLMSGKAPTLELQSLFSRFRSWLVNVYRNMTNPRAVSPEVREVMDRMLASEDAILEAQKNRGYFDVLMGGVAGEGPEADAYRALGSDATQEAISEMTARSLRDMKWGANAKSRVIKALQKTAKIARAAMKERVTKEVMDTPIEKARADIKELRITPAEDRLKMSEWHSARETALTNFKAGLKASLYEANPEAKGIEKGQLLAKNKRAIDNQAEAMALEWEKTNPRPMTPKATIEYDIMADKHGFNSGQELAEALKKEPTAKEKIAALTDQRMLEEHGELTDPVSIERAAEAAIHNELRAKMMATGLKILTKTPFSATEINKAAKAAADTAIAAMKVGEVRPAQYSAAEARSNKELLRLAPKDPANASAAQRAALLNNRLFKSATEAVTDVQKGLAYLKRFSKDSTRAKIDLDIRDQIDDILERFDLRANPKPKGTPRAQQNLEQWIESQRAAGMNPSITADMFQPAYRMPYREMTVESFRGMVDSIKALEHVGRERNTLTIKGEKHDLKEFVEKELVPKLQAAGEKFSISKLHDRPVDRGLNPFMVALDHIGSWLRGMHAQLTPQEFKRNRFDRHELLGPFSRAILEPVLAANYRKVKMLQELSTAFREQAKVLGKAWQESRNEMVFNDSLIDDLATKSTGKTTMMKITRGRMIGMATHVGNESNFDKLTKGYNWKPEDVWSFLAKNMTEKDWQAVHKIWELYEHNWPEMQAMYRRLGQTAPPKVEHRPFEMTLANGYHLKSPGGYAAIRYDALRSRKGERDAAGSTIDPSQGLFGSDYFSRVTTTNGSMNARKDGYTDAVDLNYSTVERNLHDTIHDLAYREALINVNKVLEQPTFRKEFMKAYGREEHRALQEWIGRIANQENIDRQVGSLGRMLQYARTGLVMNAIALRVTTVLKHGGSAGIKTMGYFANGGEKYLASRFAAMGTDYKSQIATAIQKFPEIHARLLQQDRDYRATASSLFEPDSLQGRAERFGHAAVAWADMMTAVPTAWAAYDRAVTEGLPVNQGGTGKPMSEADAVEYASKIVREAHGSNVESARSNIMTAPSEALRMFTMIYGFMNNSYGQLADSVSKFRTPGLGKTTILARTFMAMIVPAIWAELLNDGVPSKDELAHFIGMALVSETAGAIPGARDVVSFVKGYQSAGVVGAEAWLGMMTKGVIQTGKYVTGNSATGRVPVSPVMDMVGAGLHIPGLGQAGKTLQYLTDIETGHQPKPTSAFELIKNAAIGPPKNH